MVTLCLGALRPSWESLTSDIPDSATCCQSGIRTLTLNLGPQTLELDTSLPHL